MHGLGRSWLGGGGGALVATFMGLLFWCLGLVGTGCVIDHVGLCLRCAVVDGFCGGGAVWDKAGPGFLEQSGQSPYFCAF